MPINNIDAKTLKQWLDAGQALLIDVREPAEHEAQSIPGAVLKPLASVSITNLPDFKNKKLVMHCQKGKRGGSACEKLLAEDPSLEIYNLEGGIGSWVELGHPVTTANKAILPLDQQVQLTIGTGVLLGSLLGYLISPGFFLLSGFFGAGLVFAGLTGTCTLSKVLAKMPWNKE